MTNRIRAGSDYPALTLSDLTDDLRADSEQMSVDIQWAMLDVIDAVTEDAGLDGTCKCESSVCTTLARFREVAEQSR